MTECTLNALAFLFFVLLEPRRECVYNHFQLPTVGNNIPFWGSLCMPAPSVCFSTPRLGHPGSFTSVHNLKCMRTQTTPLFKVPCRRRGISSPIYTLHIPYWGIEHGWLCGEAGVLFTTPPDRQ